MIASGVMPGAEIVDGDVKHCHAAQGVLAPLYGFFIFSWVLVFSAEVDAGEVPVRWRASVKVDQRPGQLELVDRPAAHRRWQPADRRRTARNAAEGTGGRT